jgi:small-conductance mechanosensitive channel
VNLFQTNPDTPPLDQTLTTLSGLQLSDWVWAGSIIGGALVIAFAARRLVTHVLERGSSVFIARLVGRFVAAIIFMIGFVYALNQLGVSVGPLLGLLGLAGLAIALAFQAILENVIAGVLISIRRPFDAGDQISTNGYEGTVEDINLRVVSLVTFDGVRVFVPNSSVWSTPIVNFTDRNLRRTTLDIGVSYNSDLDAARVAILEVLRGVDGVVDEPPPEALVLQFGDSSIDFAVRFWHESGIATEWAVRDEVARAIKRRLNADGIEIPFPQRVLHLASLPKALRSDKVNDD